YFIGRVMYTDAEKTVTAARMTQYGADGRVSAQENVVFTDRRNGSVVRGQNLEYYEAGSIAAGGADAKAIVYGGRPHAVLRQSGESQDTSSIVVDATQMELRG